MVQFCFILNVIIIYPGKATTTDTVTVNQSVEYLPNLTFTKGSIERGKTCSFNVQVGKMALGEGHKVSKQM